MTNPGLVIGYHGTSRDVAERVLLGKEKHLRASTNSYDWLGEGIYCWENDYERALSWAEKHGGDHPAVLGILFQPGNCLDLAYSKDIQSLNAVSPYMDALFEVLNEKVKIPENKGPLRDYDCLLINFYRQYRREKNLPLVDTVRSPFQEGDYIAGGKSSIRQYNHIQWTIVNPEKSVVGYFRPAEEG